MDSILTAGEQELFGEMSSYELIELAYAGTSTSVEILAIYITILSAYFLVAYYFGSKLTSVELLLFSAIYTFFSLVCCFGFYQVFDTTVNIVYLAGGTDNTFALNITFSAMIVALMLSLVFMVKMWRSR